jgi:hypothetical protein
MDNSDNNKSAWNEPFFKERTIGKCVSDGISLISNRFWKIIKLALPVIALAALCITAVTFVFCNAELEISVSENAVLYGLMICVLLIPIILLTAFAYRCVDVYKERLNIFSIGYKYIYNKEFGKKTLVAFIIFGIAAAGLVCISLIESSLINLFSADDAFPQQHYGISPVSLIVFTFFAILFVIFYVPLIMALNVMMINNSQIWSDFKKGYALGWKKWGRLFALDVMINVIIIVMAVFLLAPAYVISIMQHSATLSRLQGDAVDIPGYFSIITLLILFFSSVLCTIIFITKVLPHALFYANVVCEDKQDDNNNVEK